MRSRIADQQMTSFPDSFVVRKILTPSRSSFLYHPTRFLGPSRPRHTCAYPQSGAMVGPGSAVTPAGPGLYTFQIVIFGPEADNCGY